MKRPSAAAPALAPSIIVIFGITGDLSQRKLLPALYHLTKEKLLHEHTVIVGVSRRKVTAKALLKQTELCVLEDNKICDPAALKRMAARLQMYQMDVADGEAYGRLRDYLDTVEADIGICLNRLYYLSVPPQVYGPIVKNLGEHGLNASCPHGAAMTRLLIEKPFGHDLASAEKLVKAVRTQFGEEQIFRIDHYLAKETAQNILTFRFQNPIFQNSWNNKHIRSIDIVASETIGIEGRAAFYDSIGALRDFIQSHLIQLLAVTLMDAPSSDSSDAIHAAKLALLEAIEPVSAAKVGERTTRGQYRGYLKEVGSTTSTTETFAGLTLYVNTPRWQGVPITLRSGKCLDRKRTAITPTFGDSDEPARTNTLSFEVQPNEGIGIELLVKQPGYDAKLATASMDFSYQRTFNVQNHPDAYERVLVDAVRGDRTLFMTSQEVLACWRVVEPVLKAWAKNGDGLRLYKPGTAIDDI